MGLSTFKGTFTAEVGTGNKAYTGVGFTPKALILFCTAQTAFGSFSGHQVLAIGFSDGTDDYSATCFSEDAVGTSNAHRRHASKIITVFDTAGALDFECDLVSFDADGFTLNYTTAGTAFVVHYFAIGGDDLTNAKVATFQTATSIGNQAITGAGFAPDCVMLLAAMNGNASPSPAPPATVTDAGFINFGFGTVDNSDSVIRALQANTVSEDSAATSGTRNTRDSRIARIMTIKGGSPVSDGDASLDSLDADGFTLNWANAPTVAVYYGYLALKGGRYETDTAVSPAGTGSQARTGYGFLPTGVLFTATGDAASEADGKFSLGAASAAGVEGFIAACDDDAVATTAADQLTKNDKVIGHVNPGTPTLLTEADLSAFGADGLTLNWTTVDASQPAWQALAMGDAGQVVTGGGSQGHVIG